MTCRRFVALTLSLFLLAVVLISSHFDPDSAWYYLGLTTLVIAGQSAVSSFFASKRQTIDEAFQAGYDAGFHKGERVRPKVIRLERERERSPRR